MIEDNLLRRFEVLEVYPKESVVHEYCQTFFRDLNKNILKVLEDEIHPDRFLIGHANWLKVDNSKKFYRAFLKVVVEFKDVKEIEFGDFKKIVEKLPLVEGVDFGSYKSLIEDLQSKADYLQERTNLRVAVEGHCDERGTTEYNLALGERRAKAAKNFLVDLGVSASRLTVISYGEEQPAVLGHHKNAWDRNRRGHFKIK